MEVAVEQAKVDDLFAHNTQPQPASVVVVEQEVKLEPNEDHDVKSRHAENNSEIVTTVEAMAVASDEDQVENTNSISMWAFLLKRSRHLYQHKIGNQLDYVKMTKIILDEVGDLLDEVSEFVRSCCYFQNVLDQLDDHNSEDYIELHQFLSLGILGEKKAKVHLNDLTNLPSKFQDVFSPLLKHNKEMNNDLVNDLSHIQLPNFSTLSSINSFNDSEDDLDNAFENNSSGDNNSSSNSKFSQYPRPKIVPVDYNKKKQVCVCEQCNGSWSRKEYYYHHLSVGKCTPKWIRYSAKNKNRIRCVHPNCADKKELNFTYAGIMKHIIDTHTSQETSTLQCPDCPLKFPMKAVLKFHQDSAHQAHAMICTICGKIVRDMRKHKLVHSGEKPFQCDRCSYRCSRSGTLRRHMATHLNNPNDPTRTNLEGLDPNQQPPPVQDQHQQQQQEQPPPPAAASQHTTTMQTIQIDQSHAIPIHIQEPKYIELNSSTLAEHLPPQYATTPQPSNTTTLQTVTYREFKFP